MGLAFKLQTINPYPFGWIEVISSWCKGFVWVPVMIQMMWKNLLHQKEAWMKVGYFLCWVLQPWFLHRQDTLMRCYLFWIKTSLLLPSFTILSATHFPCLLKSIAWFQIDDKYLVWYLMYSITEVLCSLEGVSFNSQPRNFIPSPKVLEPYLELGKSYLFFINSNNSTKYPIGHIDFTVQWIRNCSTSNHPKQKACPKSTNAVPSLRSSNVLCDQWHTFGFINCTLLSLWQPFNLSTHP